MDAQLYQLLQLLIVKNNIQLDKEELKLQLLSHPSYPSLHAATGVLEHFSVPNVALKVPTTPEVLEQIPNCSLINLKREHKEELVLVEKKKGHIKITRNNKKTETVSNEEFLEKWTGVIVAIEKDENVAKVSKNSSSKIAALSLLLLGLISISYFVLKEPEVYPIGHFMLSILGIILSVFIVKHELGLSSSVANSFCNLSENTSCDAVLQSKGAHILGGFKLSDLSLITFVGYSLAWLSIAISGTENLSLFLIVTISALPFTVYSLYYQAKLVKKWCPLCLGIVGVLWLQFGVLIIGDINMLAITIESTSLALFLFSFLLPFGLWTFVKLLIEKKNAYKQLQLAHFKFKRNFSLFHAVYNEGISINGYENIPGEMVFGNKDAAISLMLVTNPFCSFCKKAHEEVEKILAAGNQDIKVTFRFIVDFDNRELDLYRIVSQLLHIYNTQGQDACLENLNRLYAKGARIEEWLNEQNVHFNPGYDRIMEQQKVWCSENGINFTPAFFLNNKPFPNEYDQTDLLLFTNQFIEAQISTPEIVEKRIAS